MNQAQQLLSRLYSAPITKAKHTYLRYQGQLADAAWVALLAYAVIGGVNALLAVWAVAWYWFQ